ncbi:Pre-mRNA-splicing factor cwf25 [Gracilariopsis chorda]|uniref:Pre-mRNA-splicing factor cwf25 n=1 Tax=Gracilariopsis chorda TaxID=448386 RepID=A0A2V3IFM9_9FLOR|nr:Pre-mRNA-splicing factor cwf25 [Gracilariopsis chorda]|eukprot:PXF40899.1 Pre-mRNA-splicing factor cwf25 [Gracilariopsis chorda]
MSALKFLSKKSWHTANIKNNEKVWLKEQEEAREKSRIEELRKQIEEERKLKEAEDLEIKSGRLDPQQLLKRRRMNWMYEFGPSQSEAVKEEEKEKKHEEVLTGQKEVTLKTLEEEKEATAPSMIDIETKMREDPLLEMRRNRAEMARERRLLGFYSSKSSTAAERSDKLRRKQQRQAAREERRRQREARRALLSRKTEKDERSIDRERLPARSALGQNTAPSSGTRDIPSRDEDKRYGLLVPKQGSGVEVSKEFVPRRRRFDQPPSADAPTTSGEHGTRDMEPRRRRFDQPLSAGRKRKRFDEPPPELFGTDRRSYHTEWDEKLNQMRQDAELVHLRRKSRIGGYHAAGKRNTLER